MRDLGLTPWVQCAFSPLSLCLAPPFSLPVENCAIRGYVSPHRSLSPTPKRAPGRAWNRPPKAKGEGCPHPPTGGSPWGNIARRDKAGEARRRGGAAHERRGESHQQHGKNIFFSLELSLHHCARCALLEIAPVHRKARPLRGAGGGRVGAETVSACLHFVKVARYGIMHKLLNRHPVTACGIFNKDIFFLRECNCDFYHVCIVFHGAKLINDELRHNKAINYALGQE